MSKIEYCVTLKARAICVDYIDIKVFAPNEEEAKRIAISGHHEPEFSTYDAIDIEYDVDYISAVESPWNGEPAHHLTLSEDDFANWEWVSQALCEDETRIYLWDINVKNGRMEATNGHFAFWCDCSIQDGQYNYDGKRAEHGMSYVNISKITPDYGNWQEIEIKETKEDCLLLNNGAAVKQEYFDKMLDGEGKSEWRVSFCEDSAAVFYFAHKSNSRHALIMPIRLSGVKPDAQ